MTSFFSVCFYAICARNYGDIPKPNSKRLDVRTCSEYEAVARPFTKAWSCALANHWYINARREMCHRLGDHVRVYKPPQYRALMHSRTVNSYKDISVVSETLLYL
jgi:hypothetical protein